MNTTNNKKCEFFDELINKIKETKASDFINNEQLIPKLHICVKSDLILDSIARLINDEKTNVVSSVELFTKANNVECIGVSGNKIDDKFIKRVQELIKNAIGFKHNQQLLQEQINYIFQSYSISTLKNLIKHSNIIIIHVKRSVTLGSSNISKYYLFFKQIIQDYQDIINESKRNTPDEKKKTKMVDFLIKFTGFIYDYYYLDCYRNDENFVEGFYKSNLSVSMLVFLNAIWDAYSFNVLSKKYFNIETIKYIKIDQIKFSINENSNIQSLENKKELVGSIFL
jgi:hypothetical protein